MSKVQISLLAILLAAFSFGILQCKPSKSDSKVSGPRLTLSIHPPSEKIYSGDPIPVEFSIRNSGLTDYRYHYPGENSDRRPTSNDDYYLTCISASGHQVDSPQATSLGGAIACGLCSDNEATLKSGQEFHQTIFLNNWAKIIDPGRYSVTGSYRISALINNLWGAPATSKPETIEVLPRTAAQMDEYVRSLESKLAVAKSPEDRELLWQKLMFTMQPSLIPMLIDRMYEEKNYNDDEYYLSRALTGYLPQEKVKPLVLRACMNRGLAPGMGMVLYSTAQTPGHWDVEPLQAKEWNEVITRSLSSDNTFCWEEGCLAAQSHPSDAFTPRIISIAMDPKSGASGAAIYALALNRTDGSVAALKQLLKDPNDFVRETARSAIKDAYCDKTNKHPGRRLLPADFDPALQTQM